MKILFILPILTIAILTSCTSVEQNSFPDFSISNEAINKAKIAFKRSDNNYLCLLMVDRQGKVVKVKKLASKLDSLQHDLRVTKEMYNVVYKPAATNTGFYREYIFPYKVNILSAYRD